MGLATDDHGRPPSSIREVETAGSRAPPFFPSVSAAKANEQAENDEQERPGDGRHDHAASNGSLVECFDCRSMQGQILGARGELAIEFLDLEAHDTPDEPRVCGEDAAQRLVEAVESFALRGPEPLESDLAMLGSTGFHATAPLAYGTHAPVELPQRHGRHPHVLTGCGESPLPLDVLGVGDGAGFLDGRDPSRVLGGGEPRPLPRRLSGCLVRCLELDRAALDLGLGASAVALCGLESHAGRAIIVLEPSTVGVERANLLVDLGKVFTQTTLGGGERSAALFEDRVRGVERWPELREFVAALALDPLHDVGKSPFRDALQILVRAVSGLAERAQLAPSLVGSPGVERRKERIRRHRPVGRESHDARRIDARRVLGWNRRTPADANGSRRAVARFRRRWRGMSEVISELERG